MIYQGKKLVGNKDKLCDLLDNLLIKSFPDVDKFTTTSDVDIGFWKTKQGTRVEWRNVLIQYEE